jgi:hypothetical protein
VNHLRAHRVSWSAAAFLAIVAAGWIGHAFAQARLDEHREQMVVEYLSDLDPRVMAKARN